METMYTAIHVAVTETIASCFSLQGGVTVVVIQ